MIIRRFRERDYMKAMIKHNSHYITEDQIDELLDENRWCDLTFKFVPKATGWHTVIIDNDTEEKITFDDLNNVARNYYLQQVKELSVKQVREQIRKVLYA